MIFGSKLFIFLDYSKYWLSGPNTNKLDSWFKPAIWLWGFTTSIRNSGVWSFLTFQPTHPNFFLKGGGMHPRCFYH